MSKIGRIDGGESGMRERGRETQAEDVTKSHS